MTPNTLESNSPPQSQELLAAVLSRAHEIWIKDTGRFLLPATLDTAPFWDRWTAVRYLADQFQGQYRRERALLGEQASLSSRCMHAESMGELEYALAYAQQPGEILVIEEWP